MSVVQVHTVIDQELIMKQVQEKLDQAHREVLFTWDINEMSKRLCMGKTFLEAEILSDPRMRALQRQKPNSKRFWFYKESLEVIRQIMDEW